MVSRTMLLNIGHGSTMVKTGSSFSASCHNKVDANRIFCGGRFGHGKWRWQSDRAKKLDEKKEPTS